jgi:hypothetical protein
MKKRVGIVLFQLGGPDSLEAVEPFLRNLFLDPDIIPMGPLGFLRGPLASYIAKKALGAGARALRDDRASLADCAADRAAEGEAGPGALSLP